MSDIPCLSCEYEIECERRIKRSSCLGEIKEWAFSPNVSKEDCGIWIACDVDRKMKNGEMDE